MFFYSRAVDWLFWGFVAGGVGFIVAGVGLKALGRFYRAVYICTGLLFFAACFYMRTFSQYN